MEKSKQIDPIAMINSLEIEVLDRLQVIKNLVFEMLRANEQNRAAAQPQKQGKYVEFDTPRKQ